MCILMLVVVTGFSVVVRTHKTTCQKERSLSSDLNAGASSLVLLYSTVLFVSGETVKTNKHGPFKGDFQYFWMLSKDEEVEAAGLRASDG